MRIIENQTFTATTVSMDDTFYRNCAITNCQIIYGGGDFGWDNTPISPDCKIVFIGAAQRMAMFMKALNLFKEPTPPTHLLVGTSTLTH